MQACVNPYIPNARPTRAGSSPPATPRAATAKTGNNKNRPNIREANKPAKAKLARRSSGVKAKDWVADIELLFEGSGQARNERIRAL